MRLYLFLAAFLALIIAASAFAADTSLTLVGGDKLIVSCNGLQLDEVPLTNTSTRLDCVPMPPTATSTSVPSTGLPLRLAFYYPWFPESWTQSGVFPFTNYTPVAGYYASEDLTVISKHIVDMKYGNIQGAIASWWGQGHNTDQNIPELLQAASGTDFKWTLYYEHEAVVASPSTASISNDLTYILNNYAPSPNFLRINGKPVIFVYADANDRCSMVTRWKNANAGRFYVVLKVFPNYLSCTDQPDNWHQYSPAVAYDQQGSRSVSISPGFWLKGEAPRLVRDITRWNKNIRDMVAANPSFQLITTWNEWGEGTQIEDSTQLGRAYLEALHNNGQGVISTPTPVPTVTPSPTPVPGSSITVVAAGDIAGCNTSGDTTTANLIGSINPTLVITLGDNAYESGSATEFANCYNPTWGLFKGITRPAPGNHEYLTSGASGYFGYFGSAAGSSGQGYYSYNAGGWHFIVLNSNCSSAGGCGSTSPQANWLRSDLTANPVQCTIAYWHHPRFTRAQYDDQTAMSALYQILYDNNVDIVLAGHDHNYQRYQPMNGSGVLDVNRGIRSWVVGTGGRSHYNSLRSDTRREVGNGDTFGVLKLTLRNNAYDWQFVPEAGRVFTDVGSGGCH